MAVCMKAPETPGPCSFRMVLGSGLSRLMIALVNAMDNMMMNKVQVTLVDNTPG